MIRVPRSMCVRAQGSHGYPGGPQKPRSNSLGSSPAKRLSLRDVYPSTSFSFVLTHMKGVELYARILGPQRRRIQSGAKDEA